MRITGVETIRLEEFPNLVYLQVHTDEGIAGLGETFLGADAVEGWLHETGAPYLMGKDPLQIERHWRELRGFVGINSSGAENRGRSAVDLALWDILGKVCRQPLHQLLGGRMREGIRVYNTCAGSRYARAVPMAGLASSANWEIPEETSDANRYEDMDAFLNRADELAHDLLEQGITGMKMWPFDPYAEASDGHYISNEDLKKGSEPFRKIREAVGDRMEIMVDLHTNWDLPGALKIARMLEEYEPAWIEDPVRADDVGALATFTRSTKTPTTAGETWGSRWAFREVFERHAVDVAMFDPVWVGGVSEGKKVATMAEAFQTPVTLHDCNGPVQFSVGVHLSVSTPNAALQEFVRAYYYGWYPELVTELPEIRDGHALPLTAPGIGTELMPGLLDRSGVRSRTTNLASV